MNANYIAIAQQVISNEIAGLNFMAGRFSEQFEKAIEAIVSSSGRTIVCGMGKSGLIGKKIAASLASTGTPSFFMHPGEAFHGDLGMVKKEDIFIAISNSGETDEVLKILPFLRSNGNFIIALTGKSSSTLALNSHCHLDIGVPSEACPLQLAPTTSTTATLVMGDALTVALMHARNFQPENFARFHPGGSLGRRLLCKVRDVMIADDLPIVDSSASFAHVIDTVSSYKLGITLVTQDSIVNAIITDGDLRRAMKNNGKNVFDFCAADIATKSPLFISPDASMQVAFNKMDEMSVTTLVVKDNDQVIGILKK